MKTLDKLNREFAKLNKEYVRLDKSLDVASEEESFKISQQLEDISLKMAEISKQLES